MSDSNKRISENAKKNANLIWNVANSIAGPFKPHEYGLVILPMCVIKRFHDCLKKTADAVHEQDIKLGNMDPELKDGFLKETAGFPFYNTSRFNFDRLVGDSENIDTNFEDYYTKFSSNVQEILSRMNFAATIDRMKEAGLLYQVISDFNAEDLDMSPERIDTVDMGYIFEELVRRFSESYDEQAGAHFTSKDIIELMCELLLTNSQPESFDVYDMAMGTSQMLTCMRDYITAEDRYPGAIVNTFGQEFNPFTMGIAAADALIHGGSSENMRFGDTLSDDKFDGYTFDFVISNPPFGIDWKREAVSVEAEFKKGEEGRFAPGLPSKSDGQMLFLLNGISKLRDGVGKMAIIQNGSSLFTGDAETGPSEIRRYIIEKDWLDAIVRLPTDSFYNTGISTYVWLIDKAKPERKPGKIQLIDASECYEGLRKPIGNKRVEITGACRLLVAQAYDEYETKDYEGVNESGKSIKVKSRVLDKDDFGYRKVIVETPQRDDAGNIIKKKGKLIADTSKRDTENIPLKEEVDSYMEREVYPYNEGAWYDENRIKIGYEIQFKKVFYERKELEAASNIAKKIEELESSLMAKLHELFS